jgi:hypothetical protein
MRNYLYIIENDVEHFLDQISGFVYEDEDLEEFKSTILNVFKGEITRKNLHDAIEESDDEDVEYYSPLFWNQSFGFLKHYIETGEKLCLTDELDKELKQLLINCACQCLLHNWTTIPYEYICLEYLHRYHEEHKYDKLFIVRGSAKWINKYKINLEQNYENILKKTYNAIHSQNKNE